MYSHILCGFGKNPKDAYEDLEVRVRNTAFVEGSKMTSFDIRDYSKFLKPLYVATVYVRDPIV